MSNTNGSMSLSLNARMMRALEAHFSVGDGGALVLEENLLGRVGLAASGDWALGSIHGSTDLASLATSLKDATDAEVSRATAAEGVLQTNINTEQQARLDADAAIQADVDANELEASNDRALIRSEFAAADTALETQLLGDADVAYSDFGKVEDKIQEEVARATAAESAIQSDVDQNELDASNDRTAIRGEFAAADTALKTELLGDAAVDYSDFGKVEDKIQEEVARATAAESGIQADVDQNELDASNDRALIRSEFAAADATLQGELDDTQTGAGLAADGSYVQDGNATYVNDATSLANADKKLDDAIVSEKSRAQAAEGVLQSNIDVETARIDAILLGADADKDSFAEIVTLINSVDTENDTAFANYVLSNDAALAQEVADRGAGDDALQAELDATQSGAGLGTDGAYSANANANYINAATSLFDADNKLDAAIKVVEDDLAAEVANRIADVDAEEARALAAEGVLQSNIDSEAATRLAADNSATTDRAAIRSEFAAADTALKTELLGNAAVEFSDFGKVEDKIQEEVARATAAESAIQADVDANETAATTDRAAIRSEFAAADTALKTELLGNADAAYSDFGKVEDKIQEEVARAQGVEGQLASLNTTDKSNLVNAINEVLDSAGVEVGDVMSEVEIRASRHYPMSVAVDPNGGPNTGWVHVGGAEFGTVTLMQVLSKEAAVGAAFPEFMPSEPDDQNKANKIYEIVKHSLKVFVNGMLVPMKRDVNGELIMNDIPDAHDFQFNQSGDKLLAPSGFVIDAADFAVMMLG